MTTLDSPPVSDDIAQSPRNRIPMAQAHAPVTSWQGAHRRRIGRGARRRFSGRYVRAFA